MLLLGASQDASKHANVAGEKTPFVQVREEDVGVYPALQLDVQELPEEIFAPSKHAGSDAFAIVLATLHDFSSHEKAFRESCGCPELLPMSRLPSLQMSDV
jgi:hypothetical protein